MFKKLPEPDNITRYKCVFRPSVKNDSEIRYEFLEVPISSDSKVSAKALKDAEDRQYTPIFLNDNLMYTIITRFLLDYFMLESVTTVKGLNLKVNKTLTEFCLPKSNKKEVSPYLLARKQSSVLELIKKELDLSDSIESFSIVVTPRSIEDRKLFDVTLNPKTDKITFSRAGTFYTDSSYILTFKYLVKHYLTQSLNS